MTHTHALSERFFEAKASAAEFDTLFTHLRGCADCRTHFETLRQAHRALSGAHRTPRAGLTSHESELLKRQLLAEVASEAPSFWEKLRWGRVVLIPVLAALSLAVVYFRSLPEDPFVAKGEPVAQTTAPIQVLCVEDPKKGTGRVSPIPTQGGTCPLGSHLLVAARGGTLPAFLAAVIVNSRGEVVFYSSRHRPGPQDVFDGYFTLKESHVWVIAIGASELLDEAWVRQRAQAWAAGPEAALPRNAVRVRVDTGAAP